MGKQGSSGKKRSFLVICLQIFAGIFLFLLLAAFGWIAGIIWLIFFRKKLNDNPSKQKRYTIGISLVSVLSLILFACSMATPSTQSETLSHSGVENESEIETPPDEAIPTPQPVEKDAPTIIPSPTFSPTASPTLQPTESPVLSPTDLPSPQAESAPESQIAEEPVPQDTAPASDVGISSPSEANNVAPVGDTVWISESGKNIIASITVDV